jgi:YD repeat-containing protein
MGRVLSELRYPSGDTIYYEYDARGAQTSVKKTGIGDEALQYDSAGRLICHTQWGNQSFYFNYDAAGNRTVMINPDAQSTYYAYDARNLLQSLTDPWGYTTYYQRDALGLEIAKRLPNGVTTYHNYDAARQVTSILHVGSSGTLQSLYYTYDGDGRRTRIVREDGRAVYFGYDDASRLTGETWLTSGGTQLYAFAYQYDAAGNRKQKTFNGITTTYNYNTLNQLTSEATAGATTYYTWTADGEMATKHDATGWTYYTWDVDESLKHIQTPSDDLANLYNSRMQRVQRTEAGAVTYMLYDGEKLAEEKDGTWATQRGYANEGPSIYSPLVAQSGAAPDHSKILPPTFTIDFHPQVLHSVDD